MAGTMALLFLAGCGARTGLAIAERDGGGLDGGLDAGLDAAPDATPPECVSDAECADRVECTLDRCARGRCEHAADDARCDDGVFCNGVERCGAAGCAPGAAPSCADAVACTADRCDEGSRACVHDPDAARCPISHRCDPVVGCQARAIAHWASRLYEVDLPSGAVRALGVSTHELTDVALHPDRTFYAIDSATLVAIDPESGATVRLAALDPSLRWNALDAAPDGTLYAAAEGAVYRIDRASGASTRVAALPPRTISSGDLALLEGRLLVTTAPEFDPGRGSRNQLVLVDPASGTSRVIGPIGFSCVWGLAAFGATLYGLTCEGRVLEIDAASGRGRELVRSPGVEFWGATAR